MSVHDVPSNKGADPWLDISFAEARVHPDDIQDSDTIAIGFKLGAMDEPHMTHALIAAETNEGLLFFHKLGTDGPLALSGLWEAQSLFNSRIIRSIETIQPKPTL